MQDLAAEIATSQAVWAILCILVASFFYLGNEKKKIVNIGRILVNGSKN